MVDYGYLGNGSLNSVSKVNTDSPYTILGSDYIIRADASSGALILNLPTAVGITGRKYLIIRTDITDSTNFVTVTPSGSQTIGSCAAWRLWTGEHLEIVSDNANWQVLSRSIPTQIGYYYLKGSTANRRYVGGSSYCATTVPNASTTAPAVNTLWALPIVVSRVTKFDTISFKVTTLATAGGVARAGIYNDNGACYPGSLIFDTGSIATDAGSTSNPRDTTITSGLQIFQPGLYWLAWECGTAAPQIGIFSNALGFLSILGHLNTQSTSNPAGFGYSVAHTFGALPDPYTSSATVLNSTPSVSVPIPLISLRPI